MQESLTTMQTLDDKHNTMHPTAKGGSASKREGKKKTGTNKNSVKMSDKKKLPKSVFCSSCKLMIIWR